MAFTNQELNAWRTLIRFFKQQNDETMERLLREDEEEQAREREKEEAANND